MTAARAAPVILLHGLGRTSVSLRRLARALEVQGHPTLNLDYPSRRGNVRTCAAYVLPAIAAFQERAGQDVVLLGHSMGGLVARVVASHPRLAVQGLVMLAPPNHGSEVADLASRFALGRIAFGPALDDLQTTAAASLPRPACPIGVIAGTRSYLPFASRLFAGRNDGLVSLESSRLEGADWMGVDACHTFLMNHPDAVSATTAFLTLGRFPKCVEQGRV